MSKLSLWDIPLGVLITYRNQGSDETFLNIYSKIVSNAMKATELAMIVKF